METQDLESQIDRELEEQILFNAIEEEYENSKTLNKPKRKKKRKKVVYKLKNGLKIRTVLLLLVTLIANTYAWFIYVSTASLGVAMHVKSWSFELLSDEQSEDFVFTVEQIYPGMEEAEKKITAQNNGEAAANLTCEISYVKILDEVYQTETDYTDSDGNVFQYTPQQLLNKVLNDYPFKIQIFINGVLYDGSEQIMQTGDEVEIFVKINWEYETGNTDAEIEDGDKEDTLWGEKAYEYMQTNPDDYSIEIKMNIKAVQHNETTTP